MSHDPPEEFNGEDSSVQMPEPPPYDPDYALITDLERDLTRGDKKRRYFSRHSRLVIAGDPDPEPHGSADERKADDE